MKCKHCNTEMSLEESDMDNPYIRTQEYLRERCDACCSVTYWGLSDYGEEEWY